MEGECGGSTLQLWHLTQNTTEVKQQWNPRTHRKLRPMSAGIAKRHRRGVEGVVSRQISH